MDGSPTSAREICYNSAETNEENNAENQADFMLLI